MSLETEPALRDLETTQSVDRSVDVYNAAVRRDFAFLKRTDRFDELLARGLPIGDGRGYLAPVCDLHRDDPAMLALFVRWRDENQSAYPTRFPVTPEGTASWLTGRILDVDDRILFLVLDRHGRPVGHMGFANALNGEAALEADNIVRGVKGAQPGLMSEALKALLEWAEVMFRPRTVHLRVMADNARAIGFYRRLGFRDDALLPLRRRVNGSTEQFLPLESDDPRPADAHFLRMVYDPDRPADGSSLILTAGPLISAREASYALDAARNGWNHRWNGYLKRFESAFAEYLGVKHAIATSSCTGALHLGLLALGVGPGDEVIVPDVTWVATANAVVYTGATPVFADVDPETWTLDPASFESLIGPRTKAVMPVHLYGHPADMDAVNAVARRHGLRVFEDAAPAVGAECRGVKAGTTGDLAAFSFQGAKLLVTGEGGMLVTNDTDLYEKAILLWDQGRDPNRMFWMNQTGWKYKMANVQAALGLGQIERVDSQIEAKRLIFSWYAEGLAGVPHLSLNREGPWARSIYWMTSLLLHDDAPLGRDELRAVLKSRNIDTRPAFPAISQYPIWPRAQKPQPNALRIGRRAINLPSGVRLRREQVEYVCGCVREAVAS